MWWYGYGWWWWWVLFLIIFFLHPVGYGWGYRGWGPWYRRRGSTTVRPSAAGEPPGAYDQTGWGWGGAFLWIILLIAIVWLIAALGWGTW